MNFFCFFPHPSHHFSNGPSLKYKCCPELVSNTQPWLLSTNIHVMLLQYIPESNFSLIVKQSEALNCLFKSRSILPPKLLQEKSKISHFLCFPEYMLPFFVSNASTYICCSCLLYKLIENTNYFSLSSNYNNEQMFADHLPKVILFPHFITMSGCFEHDVHQKNDLLLRWIFLFTLLRGTMVLGQIMISAMAQVLSSNETSTLSDTTIDMSQLCILCRLSMRMSFTLVLIFKLHVSPTTWYFLSLFIRSKGPSL